MVKNKKMSKTSIAVIVLALLLVFSLVMGMTGAWFTDTNNDASVNNLQFGTVVITSVAPKAGSEGLAVRNTVDTSLTKLMPGTEISGKLHIVYGGNAAAYLRVTVQFLDGSDEPIPVAKIPAVAAQYLDTSVDLTEGAGDVTISTTIPTTVGNDMQNQPVKMVIVVDALQKANTTGANSADGAWSGVTIAPAN